MSNTKFASLHSGLIARKGEATPSSTVSASGFTSVPKPAPYPVAGMCAPVISPPPVKKTSTDKIKAITLRLDASLYRRTQVAAARLGMTAQDVLRIAIDRHLDYLGNDVFPQCACMRGEHKCN